jgi:hypothetical protein
MKNIIAFLTLLVVSVTHAQRDYDQFSIEADYGINAALNPSITGFNHFGIGIRYMLDENWGAKFDYANDRFDPSEGAGAGSDYNRFSLQGVHNLGRTLDLPYMTYDRVNLLAHAGIGYAALKSKSLAGIDNIGHVIVGVTPQLYISESLTLHLDASYVLNFTQHFNFDGNYPEEPFNAGDRPAFNAGMFTASLGLTVYLGRNKSDSDWR